MFNQDVINSSEYSIKEVTLTHLGISHAELCGDIVLLGKVQLYFDFVEVYFSAHDTEALVDCFEVFAKLFVQKEGCFQLIELHADLKAIFYWIETTAVCLSATAFDHLLNNLKHLLRFQLAR